MDVTINNLHLELTQGDITLLDVEAIVNAANSHLVLGAGVAGAIYNKGGQTIQDECNAIGHCPVGKAVITSGGNLKVNHVIHAVGPRMGEGQEEAKLVSAVHASLSLAEEQGIQSIALPAISTGIFGFPMHHAARLIVQTIIDYSFEMRTNLHHVILCLYDSVAFDIFRTALEQTLETIDRDDQDSTLLLDN